MISLKTDFNHGLVSLKITSNDDLWYLSQIIEPDDSLRMKTERKLKLGEGKGDNIKVVKKTIVLTIKAETVELSDTMDSLRIKGTTTEEHDDVPKGSYHSFSLEIGEQFTLVKQQWPKYIKDRLTEALNATEEKIYVVLFDNEQAIFARTQQSGINVIAKISGSSHKKMYEHQGNDIFSDINKELDQLHIKDDEKIAFAGPSFWHKTLQDKLKDDHKKKGVFVDFQDVNDNAVGKVLRRPEVTKLFAKQRLQKEELFASQALEALHKELLAYGFDDVSQAANAGALKSVGVTISYVQKHKQDNTYNELQSLLHIVEQTDGDVHFLYDENAVKQIDSLGGIVGMLRWQQQ